MTREELIEALTLLKDQAQKYGDNTFVWSINIDSFKFVIDSTIKALEQEPTTKNNLGVDCISRIETIDYLCKHCPDDGECFEDCDEIKHLRQMPSVTPQLSSELEKNSKKLEKDEVLDKIRAEIEQITDTMGVSYNQYVSKIDVLQIIDKYKAGSEDT